MGEVTVEFAPVNDFGVLDHVVRLPSGEAVYNPLRVIPAGEGEARCEVVFTVRQRPGMTDQEFERPKHWIRVADFAGRPKLVFMPLTGEYEPSTSDWARENAEQYMASGGAEGTELKGRPVILLTTVGAKSGKIRKTPLMRVEHDGEYAIVASLGGAPKNPVWYHNVKANPRVELQDGTTAGEYEAREVFGDEKAQWWDRAVEAWPDYANYQTKTDRQIPVFVLSPAN
jgi:F420H(2)-dependent quinone reductase